MFLMLIVFSVFIVGIHKLAQAMGNSFIGFTINSVIFSAFFAWFHFCNDYSGSTATPFHVVFDTIYSASLPLFILTLVVAILSVSFFLFIMFSEIKKTKLSRLK